MKKIISLLALLAAGAAPARAGLYYDLQQSASSATQKIGGRAVYGVTTAATPSIVIDGVAGTITGPMRDKGGQVFNVRAYGATGDGATDDSTAINAAITASVNAGGGNVYFPPGTYKFTGAPGITIASSHVHLVGAGQSSTHVGGVSTLYYVGTSTAILINASGSYMSDIQMKDIELQGTSSAYQGIYATGTATTANWMYVSRFENVSVNGFTRTLAAGMRINGALTSVVDGGYFETNYDNIVIGGVVTTLQIHHVRSRVASRYGMRIEGGEAGLSSDGLADIHITDSLFESNNDAGIFIATRGVNSVDLNISDVQLENNCRAQVDTSRDCYQLHFSTQTSAGAFVGVHLANIGMGTYNGFGDVLIGNAQDVDVDHLLGIAGAGKPILTIGAGASNVHVRHCITASGGTCDSDGNATVNMTDSGSIIAAGTIQNKTVSGVIDSNNFGNVSGSQAMNFAAAHTTMTFQTSPLGGSLTTALTLNEDQSAVLASTLTMTGPVALTGPNGYVSSKSSITTTGDMFASGYQSGSNRFSSTALTMTNAPANFSGANGYISNASSVTTLGSFFGNGSGLTGTAASLTAGAVTTDANLTGDVTSVGNATTAAATQANIKTLSGLRLISTSVTATSSMTVLGVTDGSNAPAGYVGEFISTVPTGAISVPPSGTTVSLATTTLTAGDWDVEGFGFVAVGGSFAGTGIAVCVSLTANTCDAVAQVGGGYATTGTAENLAITTPTRRINVAVNTPVFLVGRLDYTVGTSTTWSVNSSLRARRMR